MIGEGGSGWIGEWLAADVVYGIVVGVAIGAAIGLAAAWSVKRLRDADLLAPALDGYHAIATVLVIYGLAEVAGAYGFLAAFAGGLAFRRYEHDHEVNARVHEGAELSEKLLELAVVLLLGSMLSFGGLGTPGWEGWLLAALVLVAVRPLACLAALAGSRLDRPSEKSFVAWFGVRGVGSLFYIAVAVEADVLAAGERDLVVWTVIGVRAALDRRPRHHGRPIDAAPARAALGGQPLDRARGGALVDQVQHGGLELGLVDRQLARLDLLRDALERGPDGQAGVEGVEHARVDVGRAADRGRVAEVPGHLLDRAVDRALARRPGRRRRARHGECDRRERGRVPGAEVLRGEVAAGRVLEVLVDVLGADVAPAAARLVREQLRAAVAAPAAAPRRSAPACSSAIPWWRRCPLLAG